jgi:hypothetical protein
MRNQIIIFSILFFIVLTSCKTKPPVETKEGNPQNVTTQNTQSEYPTEPGTCKIQGYVIKILPIDKTISDEPCKSFACKAQVVITKTRGCGFGVQRKPIDGDTLEINFIHSMVASQEFKKVYPAKVNLPGLKPDQLFEAQIKIKLLPMDKLFYEIGTYELVH